MKVSIITLHKVKNYGSVLQTYATQKIFEKLNCEAEIINYSMEYHKDKNLLNSRINASKFFSRNFLTRISGRILLGNSVKKQCKVFNEFLNKNLKTTREYEDYEDLKNNPPTADIFCTGSDQVWNNTENQGIKEAYYLGFVKDKPKISYAASIGKTELDDFEIEETKKLLEQYKYISVREKSAVNVINKLGINNVELVLDPTLMLNKDEWEELKADIKTKGKYILVYQLNSRDKAFDDYVKNLSKHKKMPIVRISNVIYQAFKYGKFDYCPTINQFITYFLNAEYVVTDSFHATAYCINFNKKFVSIYPKRFSTRLQSILELTGLEERHVVDFNDFDLIDKEINYEKVNKIMENEKEKSMEFLRKAIK